MSTPKVLYKVLSGGISPRRREKGDDAGLDLAIRAIIGEGFDHFKRRTTIWDFQFQPKSKSWMRAHEERIAFQNGRVNHYLLYPNESISLGLGVSVSIPGGFAGYVEARGSTIKNFKRNCLLEIANDTVPIDPGFDGEIWAELVNRGPDSFLLSSGLYICQLVVKTVCNRFKEVKVLPELPVGSRGEKSNGSSGGWDSSSQGFLNLEGENR